MSNQEYINKYKDTDEIIKTYYAIKDKYGNQQIIDGIVNPFKVDNRQITSVADQQGQKPHCAAYSICNLCEAILWKRTGKLINLNADQVYAHAKLIDNNVWSEGTYLECAIKAALKLGGFENPNDIKIGFLYNDKTDKTIEQLKYLIHKYDFIHIGCMITTGYYSCNEKDPYIKHTNQNCGGHAMLAVGYDQDGLYLQNSWGKEWGAKSFGILKWEYVLKELMYACYIQNAYNNLSE